MKVLNTLMLFSLLSGMAYGSQHQIIDTLGVSPKGQYVAVEEYGYKSDKHSYYVTIKIMNVWTKKYIGKTVEVELPAHRPNYLQLARDKAKVEASQQLNKFNINT